MFQYVKKPVVIEAVRPNDKEHPQWYEDAVKRGDISFKGDKVYVTTMEGVFCASVSDYIIRGVKGEIYPCREDIFRETYVRVLSERSLETKDLESHFYDVIKQAQS